MTSTLPAEAPLLELEDLAVSYRQGNAWLEALRGVTLRLRAGEICGLVGESGSGKTTLAMAVMRSLGPQGAVRSGRIALNGRDLLTLKESEMRRVWGKQIALVPQNPQSALNPSLRVGEQVAEALRHHLRLDARQARRRTLELFEQVRLEDAGRVAESYPHQISGGMVQRVMIAMALCAEPQLLLLDEPTANLDVTTQAAILDLVVELMRGGRTAALYVSHDLGVVARVCDRVAVLYAGELVEESPAPALFRMPLHPYTRGLLESLPQPGAAKEGVPLRAIRGQIPAPGERPAGCVFRPRCPLAAPICERRPPLYLGGGDRRVRCHRWEEAGRPGEIAARPPPAAPGGEQERRVVLSLQNLAVHFPLRRSPGEALRGRPARALRAVDGISLEMRAGQTTGLVGESGSGKTTLARAIVGLEPGSVGALELWGQALPRRLSGRSPDTLRRLHLVMQDPQEAFNPYHTVGESLRRPLMALLGLSRAEASREAARLLEAVGLPPDFAARLPGQLSGGELQRVAIARAFACRPDLLVCDEATSALDVSVQAAILNLIAGLQARHGNSLLFISHNLAAVAYLADEVAVIYRGRLVEVSRAASLFEPPHHPYTEALLACLPRLDLPAGMERLQLEGEIPAPAATVGGCPFHNRCPRFLGEICVKESPPWQGAAQGGKRYACHIPEEQLRALQAPPAPSARPVGG